MLDTRFWILDTRCWKLYRRQTTDDRERRGGKLSFATNQASLKLRPDKEDAKASAFAKASADRLRHEELNHRGHREHRENEPA